MFDDLVHDVAVDATSRTIFATADPSIGRQPLNGHVHTFLASTLDETNQIRGLALDNHDRHAVLSQHVGDVRRASHAHRWHATLLRGLGSGAGPRRGPRSH